MIEKLSEYKITKRDGDYINADNNTRIINTIVVKINELVDTVNKLKSTQAQVGDCELKIASIYDQLNGFRAVMRENGWNINQTFPKHVADGDKKIDSYAEQRKWIGCVCRFWYDNPDDTVLDYLGKIQTGENGIEYYGKETYDWFPHCEPVKPDDDIIYRGE